MWFVRLVQGMYANEQSHVCVCEGYSEEFEVNVGCSPRLGTQPAALHHFA